MSSNRKLVLDLDSSEDERQPLFPKPKSSSNRVPRAPRKPSSRKPRPTVDEVEDDEGSQPGPRLKRERCDSAGANETSPRKRQKPDEEIVAIDFGMWGIGMSSSPSSRYPKDVQARKKWPKCTGETSKLPAITALPEDNEGHTKFKNREEAYVGFEVPTGMKVIAYSKTCMARTISPSPLDDKILDEDIARKLIRSPDSAKFQEAMVHILKYVKRIHREDKEKSLGRILRPNEYFHYVFTYPAACNETGKRTLRETIKKAGFNDRSGDEVTMISEAHAAASAAFIDSRWTLDEEEWRDFFKKAKAVTIIDCGALTADATTITVKGHDFKLRIAEACVSNGGNCGTTAVVCRFLKTFKNKFGQVFSAVPSEQLGRGSAFYADCEKVLNLFDGSSMEEGASEDEDDGRSGEGKYEFSLRLPDDFSHTDYDSRTKKAYLYESEIKDAFDDNFEYIKATLEDQWDKMCLNTDVIATGGGSLCPYMETSLQKFCQQEGVKCIMMPNRDSAVCRGAVIYAMDEKLFGWRLSRACFGILVREKGSTFIKWFVRRGEKINVQKGLVIKNCPGRLKLGTDNIREILYGMSLDRPRVTIYTFQEHLDDDQNPPNQPTDPGIEEVGDVVIDGTDFSQTFTDKLERALRNGEEQSIKTTISVIVDDSGKLFFTAKSGRIKLGQGELRNDATEVDPHPPI